MKLLQKQYSKKGEKYLSRGKKFSVIRMTEEEFSVIRMTEEDITVVPHRVYTNVKYSEVPDSQEAEDKLKDQFIEMRNRRAWPAAANSTNIALTRKASCRFAAITISCFRLWYKSSEFIVVSR